VTQQRKMMLEELWRRNYSQLTAEAYLRAMKGFVKHFHRGPEQLTQDHIREYQAYVPGRMNRIMNALVPLRETEDDGRDLPKDACEQARKCEGLGLITDG
jgi:hypothetical protein